MTNSNPSSSEQLEVLARRCEQATERNYALDREIALVLGWQERKVTSLGVNGRTPGRMMWVAPVPPFKVTREVPRFTGPRLRNWTAAALRSRSTPLEHSEGGE